MSVKLTAGRALLRLHPLSGTSLSMRARDYLPCVSAFHAAAVVALVALSACASNPPINSFCAWFIPGDPTDKGVFGLNSTNKISFIANHNTYDRERCDEQKLGDRSKSGGPR